MASSDDMRRARSSLAGSRAGATTQRPVSGCSLGGPPSCSDRADASGTSWLLTAEWPASQRLADACRGRAGTRGVGGLLRSHRGQAGCDPRGRDLDRQRA